MTVNRVALRSCAAGQRTAGIGADTATTEGRFLDHLPVHPVA